MNLARLAIASLVAVAACASFVPAAHAQATGKIVSANMQQIFADSQERKDLETKFKAKGEEVNKSNAVSQEKLKELQGKRAQFNPQSAEYDKITQELTKAAVEAQVASAVMQQEMIREQKRSTRSMVEKIVAAVKALAEEKGYSLVLMQVVPPDLAEEQYERMTPEQLNQLLSSRNVLYVAPDSNITAEVVARLDAAYKSGK